MYDYTYGEEDNNGGWSTSDEEVREAAIALQEGNSLPSEKLFRKVEKKIWSIAFAVPGTDVDEAFAIASLEYVEQLMNLDTTRKNVSALLFSNIKSESLQDGASGIMPDVPQRTFNRFTKLLKDHSLPDDQDDSSSVQRAYDSTKVHGTEMGSDTFLRINALVHGHEELYMGDDSYVSSFLD